MKRAMIVFASTLAMTGAALAAENTAGASAMDKAGTVTGVGSSLSESKAAGPMRSPTNGSDAPGTTGTVPDQNMNGTGSGTMSKETNGAAGGAGTTR